MWKSRDGNLKRKTNLADERTICQSHTMGRTHFVIWTNSSDFSPCQKKFLLCYSLAASLNVLQTLVVCWNFPSYNFTFWDSLRPFLLPFLQMILSLASFRCLYFSSSWYLFSVGGRLAELVKSLISTCQQEKWGSLLGIFFWHHTVFIAVI